MSKTSKIDLLWQDIASWQKDIDAKDKVASRRKPLHDQALPPVRHSTRISIDNTRPVGLASLNTVKPTPNTASASPKKQTISEKAEAEKTKGNEYFVKKDYKKAIDHYGQAIDLNPAAPVYFVNRAMAYLKLESFLEAEKDCTQGLLLQPKNVKALWRRGIALKGLGRVSEARKDLEHALTIEPNNKAILEELNKLPKPVVKPSAPKCTTPSAQKDQQRRLPIHIIDEAYSGPKGPAKITAVTPSETSIKAHTKIDPPKTQVSNPEPNKQALKNTVSPKPTALPKATLPPKFTVPRTNFEFERDWKTYKARGDDILYQYFQCIPPSSYANLFKSSLESDQFEKMIDLLETRYTEEKSPLEIFEVISGLSHVKRLDMLIMFLDKKRQQALQRLFDLMKTNYNESITQDKLSKLAKVYGIRV